MIRTVSIHALFDLDGIAPNPAWNPQPMLQEAEAIIGHDIDMGDEFVLFGRDVVLAFDTDVVVIELDVLEPGELASLIAIVNVVRGRCEFDADDFRRKEKR